MESLLPYDSTLSEKLMIGRIIRDISRFALVKVDPGSNSLQIHRLVQAVIRAQMTNEEQIEARHELHKILIGARPGGARPMTRRTGRPSRSSGRISARRKRRSATTREPGSC